MVKKVLGAKDNLKQLRTSTGGKKNAIRQACLQLLGAHPRVEWKDIICHNSARPKAVFINWLQLQIETQQQIN